MPDIRVILRQNQAFEALQALVNGFDEQEQTVPRFLVDRSLACHCQHIHFGSLT
jgi:hypothetical protein